MAEKLNPGIETALAPSQGQMDYVLSKHLSSEMSQGEGFFFFPCSITVYLLCTKLEISCYLTAREAGKCLAGPLCSWLPFCTLEEKGDGFGTRDVVQRAWGSEEVGTRMAPAVTDTGQGKSFQWAATTKYNRASGLKCYWHWKSRGTAREISGQILLSLCLSTKGGPSQEKQGFGLLLKWFEGEAFIDKRGGFGQTLSGE